MRKKLAALLTALALCLTLLPAQAFAAEISDPPQPPAVVVPVESDEPGIQVQSEEGHPEKDTIDH